ncbi:MAG: hypothetical protein P4L86_21155 [Mycobacterium sp.]|nr:hypothetical protein [Mycobacterium sp.]
MSAAATTATAVTVAAAAPTTPAPKPVVLPTSSTGVDLSSFTSPFPPPGTLPDLTFGVGSAAYNLAQNTVDSVLPQIVNALNLGAIGSASGLSLTGILNQVPKNLLPQILNALPLNLTPLLSQALGPILTGALVPLLQGLGIMDHSGNVTLGGLLGLLGINPDNLLDLGGLSIPGVKIVTAGPAFTLLKMLGVDLGWTPGTENAVANAINNTQYLDVGAAGLLNTVLDKAAGLPLLAPLVTTVQLAINTIAGPILNALDVIDVRVPISIGFGLGAFSTGQAYSKVLADLSNQPGGLTHTGASPILGSLTILPEVLLNNLGRANGGLLARFYPIGDLLGINTITPDVAAAHSGGIPLLNTGLAIGGANLLPIKVDATLEYQPFSDLAAWANPFSLANNLVAGTLPTYLLRGISTNTLTTQLTSQLGALTGGLLTGNPLAVNIYLTIPTATLPLLEPLYLTGDVLNMVSFGTLGTIPYRLANALAPALTSLVNLGYTDVVRNADGTYSRTLDQASTPTPFMSFPNVNWQQVPGDIINSLMVGFQKEFSGNPTAAPPNVIEAVLSLLTGGKLGAGNPLAALTGAVQGLINNITGTLTGLVSGVTANPLAATAAPKTLAAISPVAATTVPSTNPTLTPLSLKAATAAEPTATDKTDKTGTSTAGIGTDIAPPAATSDGKTAADPSTDGKDKSGTKTGADTATGASGTKTGADTATGASGTKTGADTTAGASGTKTGADTTTGASGTTTGTDTKTATGTKADQSSGRHAAKDGTPSTPDSGKKPKHAASDDSGSTGGSTTGSDTKAGKSGKSTSGPSLNVVRGGSGSSSAGGAGSSAAGAGSSTGSKANGGAKDSGAKGNSDSGHGSEGGSAGGHAA